MELLDDFILDAYKRLPRLLVRKVHPPLEVHDVVQETLLRFCRAANRIPRDDWDRYLTSVALNTNSEMLRSHLSRLPKSLPGWHADPFDKSGQGQRWFDGRHWTSRCMNSGSSSEIEVSPAIDNYALKRSARDPIFSTNELSSSGVEHISEGLQPDDQVGLRCLIETVQDVLDPLEFQVLLQRALLGTPYEDLAKELGKSPGRVRQVMASARRKLNLNEEFVSAYSSAPNPTAKVADVQPLN